MSDIIKVGVQHPKPHSKGQELIMGAFRIPTLKKIYVACGTKYGKSLSAGTCETQAAMARPNTKWRWVAPIYEQARVGMDYFRKLLPPAPHSEFREGQMRVFLPYINTHFQFWHCKNPISLEGAGIDGYIFDEAAKCPYAAVASATTTTTLTQGPHGYFSTPFGKNWFYKECMEAKEHMAWAIKNGRPIERIFIHAPTRANPHISPAVLAEAKRALPRRLWLQYYEAEFLDDGSVMIGFRECVRGPMLTFLNPEHQFWARDDADKLEVVIGVDWAKKEDYLVITALGIENGKIPSLVGFSRFHGVGYTQAVRELYRFCKKFKSVIVIKHDKTGVGEALDDIMSSLPFPIEGVIFNSLLKSEMVTNLSLGFEKRELALVDWPEMLAELDAYTVITSALGVPRFSAPPGLHDDIVSSLLLAYAAATEYLTEFKFRYLEDLEKEEVVKDDWIKDMDEY